MARGLQITATQVTALSSQQLVELLRRLLLAEARTAGIARRGVLVPAQITVADDGEDGSIIWSDGPASTNYLPTRQCRFQSKASNLEPADCKEEVKDESGALKAAIRDCFSANGAYIVFCSKACNAKMIRHRLEALWEGIRAAGGGAYEGATVEFYDANKIADWVNSHPEVTLWLIEQTSGFRPTEFRTWERWGRDEDLSELVFVESPDATPQLEQIRAHLSEPRAVARLVGLSGLGKTRLAFESFRPSTSHEDVVRDAQSSAVLYGRADFAPDRVIAQVQALCDDEADVVLIVDDCPPEVHRRLKQIVRQLDSKLSLLTLDYDPTATAGEEHLIRMRAAPPDVVKGILAQQCPQLSKSDVSRVVDFAQGFPRVAVLLGRALLSNDPEVGSLSDDELAEKLVAGRSPLSERARDVIRVCAMFEVLGIEGGASDQMRFAAEHLCRIDPRHFYEDLQDFINRGLLQKRGDFVQVQPKPLALRLAAEKWKRIHPDESLELFQRRMPAGLTKALCDQLAKLDFLAEARAVAGRLCEPTGPFGRAEVLNTEAGSRCFRSLVETNPVAAMETLVREFGGKPTEELRQVGPGRHNLVGALAKLAFREATFIDAASLLLAFAAAENESWANNATGEFLEKFQLHLSGTEAGPRARFQVLDDAIASGDVERKRLAVDALARALQTNHFTRMGGAEVQGSGAPLEDWRPATYGDMRNYYRESLSRLTAIASSSDPIASAAKSAIGRNIRGIIRQGLVAEVHQTVRDLQARHGPYWAEALEGVLHSLEYDGHEMPQEYRGKAEALKADLMPKSKEDRLRFFVSDLPWGLYVARSGGDRERDRLATDLAIELVADESTLWRLLPDLLRGEQRQIYPFGRALSERHGEPARLVAECIQILQRMPPAEANDALLGSILAGLEGRARQIVDETLDSLGSSNATVPDLVRMTTFIKITERDLDRIRDRVEKGRQPIGQVAMLAYGSMLIHLPPRPVAALLGTLVVAGDLGGWVALEIGMMFAHGDRGRRDAIRPSIRRIVLAPGLLQSTDRLQMSDHHLQEAVELLMEVEGGDEEVAIHLAREFVRLTEERSIHMRDHAFWESTLPAIARVHPRAVWDVLSPALTGERGYLFEFVLDESPSGARPSGGVLDALPTTLILEWCRRDPDKAPGIVMRNTKLLPGDTPNRWSPLVEILLDEFGDRDDVLNALGVAMGTFSWWGSLVPYYEQYIAPLNSLQQHKHRKVRRWAAARLKDMDELIKRERKREAEQDFGVY